MRVAATTSVTIPSTWVVIVNHDAVEPVVTDHREAPSVETASEPVLVDGFAPGIWASNPYAT